ncbi:MAG: hypothetical protein HYW90_01450 [Candidatus Sungbacteria bacterium]|nr:hypothetical protein [Candidatus Sungbacteria bacterium]
MVKEYFVEEKNKETGETRRQKLGPAYFEDSPQFKRDLEMATGVARQAIFEFFGEAYNDDPGKGKTDALSAAREAEARLRQEKHDATLALAAVESEIGLIDFTEDAREERTREAGADDMGSAIENLQEARERRIVLERASELLFAVHPSITGLYERSDIAEWLRLRMENLSHRIRQQKNKDDTPSNVEVGNLANIEDSMGRYLKGNPSAADYQTIMQEAEEQMAGERRRLGALMLKYADGEFRDDKIYQDMVKSEQLLGQFYQMERLLAEEQRERRHAKTI